MTTRRYQIKQLLAAYRGMGLTDDAIAGVVNGFQGERDVTIDEIETALHQEALASGIDAYENEQTSGDLAIAGGLRTKRGPAHRHALSL